jgi:uncharacterized membrane protein
VSSSAIGDLLGYLSTVRLIARIFSGPVMALLGINHFVMPKAYESIMPDYLPAHRELVYASGVAEIVGALATLHPKTRRAGGWFLIATLVAIFPANVHMAMNPADYPKVPGGETTLYVRLPLQVLFVYWVWLATLKED